MTLALASPSASARDITLLKVSYDPTREFYADFNKAFSALWMAKTGDTVTVRQSHGGSGKQVRRVEVDVRAIHLSVRQQMLYRARRQVTALDHLAERVAALRQQLQARRPERVNDFASPLLVITHSP